MRVKNKGGIVATGPLVQMVALTRGCGFHSLQKLYKLKHKNYLHFVGNYVSLMSLYFQKMFLCSSLRMPSRQLIASSV